MYEKGGMHGLSDYSIRKLPDDWKVEFTESEIRAIDEKLGTNYWDFAEPQK